MTRYFHRILTITLAFLFLFSNSVLWAVALEATKVAPSLRELPFENSQLEKIYAKVDQRLDISIKKAFGSFSERELKIVTKALAAIQNQFELIDEAYSDRDIKKLRTEIETFKRYYATLSTFLTAAAKRDQPTATAPVVSTPLSAMVPIDQNAFSTLGVKLDPNVSTSYLRGETLHVAGSISTQDDSTLLFLLAPDKKTRFIASLPVQNGRFQYDIPLKETGDYSLVVAAGKSFETKNLITLTVTDPTDAKTLPAATNLSNVISLSFGRINFSDLSGVNIMSFGSSVDNSIFYTVEVSDGKTSVIRRGIWTVAFFYDDFSAFAKNAAVQVKVSAQRAASKSSADVSTAPKIVFDQAMTLAPSYAKKNEIGWTVNVKNNTIEITGKTPASPIALARELFVVKPDGAVDQKFFDQYLADTSDNELMKSSVDAAYSFDVKEPGVYLVEVNYDTGFAAVNVPVIIGNTTLPLGMNVIDQMRDEDYESLDEVRRASLEFLNNLRAEQGLGKLRLSEKFGQLAQIKADDMKDNTYVGHVDSQGVYIDGTAERSGISFSKSISENVAGGNVTYGILDSALSVSGGHRSNMLAPEWTTVGIGIARSGNQAFYVQVFGME